ncbi:PQQ-binding-like beta-propeller repeat protein [Streptomyces sp. NPDC057445]|uniref:outer membrane protein assembly factor BamB family protein n=1 Tax=Streptomyces sp. NPDC057445 TaxID=3346136 RepID=UPI0036B98839
MDREPGQGSFEALADGDPVTIGRYRIVARLGAGGMGRVYLGRSPSGRAVAVKVVRPELAEDGEFRRRFAREVGAASRVNGFFTAGVVDADPEGSPAWLATAYVPGVPLSEAVLTNGPWPQDATLTLGAGLAEALESIHGSGVVHRDLKPSNVLLAADGPRVIDFGISAAADVSVLTQTGTVIGTPGYMAPEQLTGQPVGPACDVFALGAVLAFTATGTGPFGAGSAHALNFRAVYEQPDLDALPTVLRDLVADCLAKEAGQRPTVAALLDRLGDHGDAPEARRTLHKPGWLPETVAATVLARAAAPQPATPSPSTVPASAPSDGPPPAQPPKPVGTAITSTPDAGAPQATTALPGPAPALQEARDKVPGGPGPYMPAPTGRPGAQSLGLSRRQALFGLVGVGVAGAGYTAWRVLDRTGTQPGQQLWVFPTGKTVNSTPAIADGVVYVGSGNGTLYAVDSGTGKERWTFRTGEMIESSPAVADGTVYVGSGDGNLYAVDAGTGKRRWAYRTGPNYTSPVVVDGVVYIGSNNGVHAVDAADGKPRWTSLTGVSVTSPAVADGAVIVGSGRGLISLEAATGSERWRSLQDKIVNATPTVTGDRVHVGSDDGLRSVKADNGGEWEDFPAGGPVGTSSATVVAGIAYFGSKDGNLYGVDATTAQQRLKFPTADSVDSTPAVVNGVVYFGSDDGHLYAVDMAASKERWRFAAKDTFFTPSSPTVSDGVLYIGTYGGDLLAIAL